MGSSSKEQLPSSPSTTTAGEAAETTIATSTVDAKAFGDAEECSPLQQKETEVDNPLSKSEILAVAKTSVKRASLPSDEPAEPPLRVLLSDPLTGDLMEDATLLPCGHSFGSGGVQRVLKSSSCVTCGLHVSKESLTPNLALRAVVKAFRREERNRKALSRKRQRERFIQGRSTSAKLKKLKDPTPMASENASLASPQSRGPQFPFSVGDKVMIKGNKRTRDHFVNREAIITAQCLNGWFMLKTLDNGEVVKLQHRSLVKVTSS